MRRVSSVRSDMHFFVIALEARGRHVALLYKLAGINQSFFGEEFTSLRSLRTLAQAVTDFQKNRSKLKWKSRGGALRIFATFQTRFGEEVPVATIDVHERAIEDEIRCRLSGCILDLDKLVDCIKRGVDALIRLDSHPQYFSFV